MMVENPKAAATFIIPAALAFAAVGTLVEMVAPEPFWAFFVGAIFMVLASGYQDIVEDRYDV